MTNILVIVASSSQNHYIFYCKSTLLIRLTLYLHRGLTAGLLLDLLFSDLQVNPALNTYQQSTNRAVNVT